MNRLLIVVDYQNDFVTGSLGFPGAESYYHRIVTLIRAYEEAGDDVVFTRDQHDANYLHTEEGRNLPIPHCLKGTDGLKFYGDIENLCKPHMVFEKETFPSLALGEWLTKKDYAEITLVGLDLSICVLSNAVIAKAGCPNAHIKVDLSASGCADAETTRVAVLELKRLEVEVADLSKETKGYF
jgi:nicotinamidase-related amidase